MLDLRVDRSLADLAATDEGVRYGEQEPGEQTPGALDSLEVILGRLRRKLAAPGQQSPIRTVRGEGLVFEAGP